MEEVAGKDWGVWLCDEGCHTKCYRVTLNFRLRSFSSSSLPLKLLPSFPCVFFGESYLRLLYRVCFPLLSGAKLVSSSLRPSFSRRIAASSLSNWARSSGDRRDIASRSLFAAFSISHFVFGFCCRAKGSGDPVSWKNSAGNTSSKRRQAALFASGSASFTILVA